MRSCGVVGCMLLAWIGALCATSTLAARIPVNQHSTRGAPRRLKQASGDDSSGTGLATGLVLPTRDVLAAFTATNFFRYQNVVPADSVDWTPYLKPVPDQGMCGSCWAHATTAAMEGATAAFYSPTDGPPAYSVEEILECATEEFYNNGNGNLFGCGGGSAAFGLLHAVDYGGIGAEVYEPYAAAAGNETLEGTPLTISDCSAVPRYQPIDDVAAVPARIYAMMQAVTMQPIAITVLAGNYTPDGPYNFPDTTYTAQPGEIYRGCSANYKSPDHAVTLVGYGTNDDGDAYWIVRNSWGPNWGDNGNIYLPISETDDFDGGPCGMQVINPFFPVVSTQDDPCGTYNPCGTGVCQLNDTSAAGYSCSCGDNSTEVTFPYVTANSTDSFDFTTCALNSMCEWWGPEGSCGVNNTCIDDLDNPIYYYDCNCSDGFTLGNWAVDASPACVPDASLEDRDCPAGTEAYAVQPFDNCYYVREGDQNSGPIMTEAMFDAYNPDINCYNLLVGQQLCVPSPDYASMLASSS